ncbi:MAG: hypothetical protein ACTSWF_02150 [Candidatus Freyarchaeota archaeon]
MKFQKSVKASVIFPKKYLGRLGVPEARVYDFIPSEDERRGIHGIMVGSVGVSKQR